MASRQPTIAPDWYQLSFDSLYPIVYAHRDADSAQREAEFCIEQLGISKSDTVLDLCCGNGRHMMHLAPRARRIVGLDFSAHLLTLARQAANEAWLVRADMRRQPFASAFDVVANFFTSFGYFLSREDNLRVVREITRSLKPGGRFFIDYINLNWAKAHVEPRSVRFREDYEIREERWIDEQRGRMNKTTRVLLDGRQVSETGESVQLYTLDEMAALLTEGGLRMECAYGDYSGSECCEPSKPRMILIGRKA